MREGTNKAGEKLTLQIDQENGYYAVNWYGLCGYDLVTFPFSAPEAAQAFFSAALESQEYEPD